MATTESRTGFRLPWSADRAPSRDGSEENPKAVPNPGDSERSASGAEAAQALDPAPDPEAGTATVADDGTVEAASSVPDDRAPVPDAPVVPVAPAAARVADQAPARRPTKFLVDLTHAMQVAAELARAATLEQFQVEGSSYVEQIHGRSVAGADALRRRADEDVASIKDWSKAEIARIREETENRIAGRRGQLDGQLARHAALVERDVARIEGQIASFEAEMADFFDELLAETDLSLLAARAQQMPEAPAFDELDDAAFSALMTEPGVGIPPIAPIAAPEPTAVPEPTAGAAGAAASLEAATAETAGAEACADAPAAQLGVAPRSAPDDVSPALDSRLGMFGLTPDFAAAEAAAAEAAAAEMRDIPQMNEQDLAARLADFAPASASGVPPDDGPPAPVVSTQVIVTGLVSVASIASFKRNLSRAAGVRHVAVSSGLDGEFLFSVQHEADVSLRDLIPRLPGFQAQATGGGDGVVTVSAHDPED